MKVTDIRRKLAASLVAGGLMMPIPTLAANLDTNLLTDPGFEDTGSCATYGCYLNSWNDGTGLDYTYFHNFPVPSYANGSPLAGGGLNYFNSNFASPDGDVLGPGVVAQSVDVSTGDSATLIASGEAAIGMSGFFSSFLNDGDFGTMHLEFLDGASSSLGSVQVSDSDTTTWTQERTSGFMPVGTESLLVSLYGTALAGGPDGYIDNVDVQITAAANLLMFLEVNTTTGVATLKNETGGTINIDYYEITSAGNSLDAADGTGWNSLQDQNMAGFPAGNGSGNGWEEAGGSGSGVLSESFLTANSAVADQAAIGLGALYDPGDPQDLVFSYGVVGTVALDADFDNDNDTDGNDFLEWQQGFGTIFDSTNLVDWEGEFGSIGGPGGTSTLVTGFVRYVTSAATAVPEPSSVMLVGMGLATLLAGRRRD
jgi:hypothetical protein